MRALGLRPQILLLLGGLLVLAFAPLHLALATYTQVTLRQLDDAQARAIGHTLGAYVRRSVPALTAEQLMVDLEQNAGPSALVAAGMIAAGKVPAPGASQLLASFGDAAVVEALIRADGAAEGQPRALRVGEHRLWAVAVPTEAGSVLLAIDAERSSARGRSLIGMFGLYAFLIAFSLLTLAYFALTRLIVRPLDALSHAAENVTLGTRRLSVPVSGPRELGELGVSLERMTNTLLAEEESLRNKIAEVERARSELASTQTELVRSERLASVGRLAAGLAHEIGNPIAAMMGLADLLLDGELEPHEQRDFIQRMRSETERVHRTLADLLEFARPTRDVRGAARSASGDVEAAIHDTAALVVHQPSLRDIELHIDVYPGLCRVTLSSEQLSQVLLNLILNASDAVQGRAGARIAVVAREGEGGVRIHVEDNGPGVPADVAGHIFEPFFTTKEVGKGTGLGLSICQGLLSAAGGSLSLDVAHAHGARFVVQLPAAVSAVDVAGPSGARDVPASTAVT
jgi:two-component system NtrC family sensor kinase